MPFVAGVMLSMAILVIAALIINYNQENFDKSSDNSINSVGGITGLPAQPDFRIQGNYTVARTIAPGNNVSGYVTLIILNPEPIAVFLNDEVFNGTSILPSGISVQIASNGAQFMLERVTSVGLSSNHAQFIQTSGLSKVNVSYLIHVNSDVLPGKYAVVLYFVTYRNGGMDIYSGYMFTVMLTVV